MYNVKFDFQLINFHFTNVWRLVKNFVIRITALFTNITDVNL